MDLSKDLASAVERSTVKRNVALAIAKLSPADRRGVLLDLLAEDDAPREIVESNGVAAQRPQRRPTNERTQAQPPAVGGGEGGRANVLAALKSRPGAKSIELAEVIFGVEGARDKKKQSRVRSALFTLKKQNKVRSLGSGRWEVLSTK